ncbi:MAG: VPLPA-CTERM sorting domain-containing protein [Gammaproteobacteria bacterium]|nr:VPLPA-CTERM sorting domain-containing protein [Gammaproteobacteria bacterium]
MFLQNKTRPYAARRSRALACSVALACAGSTASLSSHAADVGLVPLGGLTDYLFVFTRGEIDLNWQSASKGYVGDIAVDGVQADERTSGTLPYAGTITTNDTTLGAWQDIVDDNPGQAAGVTGETALITGLEADLANAFATGNALAADLTYNDVDTISPLNTQNGTGEFFVIDVTGNMATSNAIEITGDANDFFLFRWDDDGDLGNGFDGQVKFQSGGGINPLGDLGANNFVHFAGDINASGGGDFSAYTNLQDELGEIAAIDGGDPVSGGGLFTGYWLTTGTPPAPGESSAMSNAIFVGGWYTEATKLSLTSGSSGVYVAPIPLPAALWLFGSGLAGLLALSKRAKKG